MKKVFALLCVVLIQGQSVSASESLSLSIQCGGIAQHDPYEVFITASVGPNLESTDASVIVHTETRDQKYPQPVTLQGGYVPELDMFSLIFENPESSTIIGVGLLGVRELQRGTYEGAADYVIFIPKAPGNADKYQSEPIIENSIECKVEVE